MTRPPQRATAFAPASASNLAVGFDILGHPAGPTGDRVTVTRRGEPGIVITGVTGLAGPLPMDPAANTATVGLIEMLAEVRPGFGLEVSIHKGIPLGSGTGGSAASAVAAIVAANAVLPEPLEPAALFRYALMGEAVASGAVHGDNAAPCLFGGLVLVRSAQPMDIVTLPVPATLRCAMARPHQRLDTRAARQVLPPSYPLADVIRQTANLAGVVAGCCTGDLALVGRSLRDVLIEPHRAALIPGFHEVKEAAMAAGALGCSISGAGPSLFAWCDGGASADAVRGAMVEAFAACGVAADGWTCAVGGPGARVEELS
ncbi:MAG: Homoserine kinase [uncultured Gemmatimonadetes bacterium]|uniref:Homoserine kinase n=1 Tax=uncultured Gemmatimonadota bacterium TaxID=203437 RepID=A0A6J4MW42_9BACT|nr:MAG: Homoserine kinase [uncultured Gemmatimonadota bacterium]